MHRKSDKSENMRVRRWWAVAVLAGLGLVVAVVMASASTTAPRAYNFRRKQLSAPSSFAAYPDVAVGANGLLVAVWTEGDPENPDNKHIGPLKLGWVSDSSGGWQTMTVDPGDVYDAAVAVSGSTVHLVWSWGKTVIRYTSCTPPTCAALQGIAAASVDEALQVDVAVDGSGTPYVVWVEDDALDKKKVYYTRKEGQTWRSKDVVGGSGAGVSVDSEGPAIAYANNYLHVAWTEWENVEHTDSEVKYCRWNVVGGSWSCRTLADWDDTSYPIYLARNLSIAADAVGNVYVAWDFVSINDTGTFKSQYAIGYKHSDDNGENWKDTHAYPRGTEFGSKVDDVLLFASGEQDRFPEGEYVAFLRPHVSLATSGTMTVPVPVLAWHSRTSTGGSPELAQVRAENAFKVHWTYARQPGSYDKGSGDDGYMFWAQDYFTVSTDLCGVVDLSVDSATAALAVAGDLNDVKDGGQAGGDSYLHAVYHEEIGSGAWGVIYNNNVPVACQRTYLPVVMRNASGGDDQ